MKLRIQCILRTRKGLSMMELNKDCMYCMEDERRDNLMIEIAKLEVSTVFLFKEQTYKGRCNVVYKDHVKELFHLDDENLAAYMRDVKRTAAAIDKAFQPGKLITEPMVTRCIICICMSYQNMKTKIIGDPLLK